MVTAWETNNPSILTSMYLQVGTDAVIAQFGMLGHKLAWWKKNHPDWILYECDQTTIAYIAGSMQTPLDISNPAVITYLQNLIGPYSESNGYSALGLDFVQLENLTGTKGGPSRGCGVWTTGAGGPTWVQKFSGNGSDPAYAAAVLNYLSSFRSYLHGLSRPLALWGNHIVATAAEGDPQEEQLLGDLDLVLDESSYARYGSFSDQANFKHTLYWADYLQTLQKGYIAAALFHTSALSNAQLEYAIASYLMSKNQASALYAFPYGNYGIEYYYPSYAASVGSPCGKVYGGPGYQHLGELVYYRQYTGALSVLNTGSKTYSVNLPQTSYVDAVTGAAVTSPLTVGPFAGFVLLNSAGCP